MLTRKRKLLLNTVTSVAYEVISLICGFILPRFFLKYYGSAINGLVSSITQFLHFITLAEMGVGAVVRSALYQPLAQNDKVQISRIVVSSERFFRTIALILAVYTVGLIFIYPIVIQEFGYLFTAALILIISLSSFAQYYFGMTYRLLLSADQMAFVTLLVRSVALILNTCLCVLFMVNGASIHAVKLTTSLLFVAQPLIINHIAKKRYQIDRKIKIEGEPIKQKWNGLAQHFASVILGNTDVVVLTFFSTMEHVSVYTVYHLAVAGVKTIVNSVINGTQAFFGNMLAKKEMSKLNQRFDFFEWAMHLLITMTFSITAFLILPFVRVYTHGIHDTNYIYPVFAYIITAAEAMYCMRIPYNTMVLAAGHFKQTQWSALIEAGLNVFISIAAVAKWGLVGVALGTLIAMSYRTVYLALYLRDNIINREFSHFVYNVLVDILCVTVISGLHFLMKGFFALSEVNYLGWFILAIKTGMCVFTIVMIINAIFYGDKIKKGWFLLRQRVRI